MGARIRLRTSDGERGVGLGLSLPTSMAPSIARDDPAGSGPMSVLVGRQAPVASLRTV